MILFTRDGVDPKDLLHYFTINVNILTALGASMLIPYAIEGVRKKHFSCPKWMALFFYSGTVCMTIVMFFAVALISWFDRTMAFGGYNRFLHIVCPLMILITFFLSESRYEFTLRDAVLSIIPLLIYEVIYLYEVVFLGPEKGGWEDLYFMTAFIPFYISAVLVMLLALGIALLLRYLHNRFNRSRMNRLVHNLWEPEVDPTEIKLELFGLGRYMGKYESINHASLPLDIIDLIARRYNIRHDELIRAYVKGMLDSLNERQQ